MDLLPDYVRPQSDVKTLPDLRCHNPGRLHVLATDDDLRILGGFLRNGRFWGQLLLLSDHCWNLGGVLSRCYID